MGLTVTATVALVRKRYGGIGAAFHADRQMVPVPAKVCVCAAPVTAAVPSAKSHEYVKALDPTAFVLKETLCPTVTGLGVAFGPSTNAGGVPAAGALMVTETTLCTAILRIWIQ